MRSGKYPVLGFLLLAFGLALLVDVSGGRGQGPDPGEKKGKKGDPKKAKWDELLQDPGAWDKAAEWEFERKDDNRDGFLNSVEMEGKLRDGLAHWDKNGDSLIDFAEYRRFFAWKLQEKSAKEAAKSGAMLPEMADRIIEPEEPRPTVYRAGKLPKELPAWFQKFDINRDGQVSLFEWLKAGKRDDEEFPDIDRNDDGFLTVEEVLRFAAKLKPSVTIVVSGNERQSPLLAETRMEKEKKKKDWDPDTKPKGKKEKKPKY